MTFWTLIQREDIAYMAMADTLYKVSGETADNVVCLHDIKRAIKTL